METVSDWKGSYKMSRIIEKITNRYQFNLEGRTGRASFKHGIAQVSINLPAKSILHCHRH